MRGRYVYGDLCGGVWSVRITNGRATRPRPERIAAPGPLVSIVADADGELLLVSSNGTVARALLPVR